LIHQELQLEDDESMRKVVKGVRYEAWRDWCWFLLEVHVLLLLFDFEYFLWSYHLSSAFFLVSYLRNLLFVDCFTVSRQDIGAWRKSLDQRK
jgi:hypothetical protein